MDPIHTYCYANGNDLMSFHMKTISKIYTNTYHKYERDNVYTIHTKQIHPNKYIERDLNKPTTTSIKEKKINKYTNAQKTSGRNRVLEMARTRIFCFKGDI